MAICLCLSAILLQDDIVIIPAFGTTLQIEKELRQLGIEIRKI